MSNYVYIPYCARPDKGRPYFATGGVHWSPEGARKFMGDVKTWRALKRRGWRIVRVRLRPTTRRKRREIGA